MAVLRLMIVWIGGLKMTRLDRRSLLAMGGAAAASAAFASGTRAQTAPAGAPPQLSVYAEPPMIEHIALSPDGSHVAFISHKGDDKVLGVFAVADKKITTLGLGAQKVRGLMWGDNSHVVLIDSSVLHLPEFAQERGEFSQAQIIDIATSKITLIYDNMDDFYGIVLGTPQRIKVNGEYRLAAMNYRMPGLRTGQMEVNGDYNMCLYSFSLTGATVPHLIYEGTPRTRDFVLSPAGLCLAHADFNDEGATHEKEWSLFYNGGTAAQPSFKSIYSVRGALEFPDLEGIGRDGKSIVIAVKNPDDSGFSYREIAADGTLGPELDPEGADQAHTPLFHPTTGVLAGFIRRDDWFSYHYDDSLLKKLAEALPQALGEDYRFSIADVAEDPRKMLVYVESAEDAGSYVFIDFETGATAILASNYAALAAPWVTQKQAIAYKAGDGLDIHAYLTLPPGKPAKGLPLIVFPHGGPGARDYIDFDAETQAFASRGYAVLQPNFRGSTGYGHSFHDAGYGEWGGKMQTDLSDGVKWLAAKGIVDASRVAIYGASYGGYAALAGATIDPAGTYRCAVAIAGVSDISSFLDGLAMDSDSRSHLVESEKRWFGPPSTYAAVSPARQAAKASCPVLIIHGTGDTVVPIAQSQRMADALKAAGKSVSFITYPGQDHWETMGSSRVAMLQAAMDFIGKYNAV